MVLGFLGFRLFGGGLGRVCMPHLKEAPRKGSRVEGVGSWVFRGVLGSRNLRFSV